MQAYLTTLGCRLNEAELEHWANEFITRGVRVTVSPLQADMIVINTCAVTGEAVRKSRQIIRRTHRHNPSAKIIVSGCFSSLNPEIAGEIEGIDLVIPNRDKDKLVEITMRHLSLETMPSLSTLPGESALFTRGRNRAFVKIQDGCRNQCTFCIVTVARGEERSRPVREIIDEINTLHSQGINEVVLTGVHVGGYGSDIKSNLQDLLQTVLLDTDIPRVRLGSVEPWDLPDGFFTLFENRKMMPHLHLPLQSGSDRILRRMARRCNTGNFTRLVETARDIVKEFNITTDIIVGFPGETERDWTEGLEYIQGIGFSHIHIFPFSPRNGTRAASLPGAVDVKTKKNRSRQLHQISTGLKKEFYSRFTGKTSMTKSTETGSGYGYTPNFMRVRMQYPRENIQNRITRVTLGNYDASEGVLQAVN